MTNKSNARYLGKVIDGPLIPVKQDPPPPMVEENAEGDVPEPDPEEMPDQNWSEQKKEYEL